MTWEEMEARDRAEMMEGMTELEKSVASLFYLRKYADFEMKLSETSTGYSLVIKQMYDYIEFENDIFIICGLAAIAEVLGCLEADEVDRYHSSGCETCDYGSNYEVKWRFWNKKEPTPDA